MTTYESLTKPDAAERTMRVGEELIAAVAKQGIGELTFRKAISSPWGNERNSPLYQILSFYRIDLGGENPDQAEETLNQLQAYFAQLGYDEGANEGVRWLGDGYGDFAVRDTDTGFSYTLMIMKRHVGISLFISSPPFDNPDPKKIFYPIRPTQE